MSKFARSVTSLVTSVIVRGTVRARRGFVAIAMSIALPLGLIVVLADAQPASASTTHYPVAVILCNTPEQNGAQELPTSFYQSLFTPGSGGVADWFSQVSRGHADLAGTQVLGPYTLTNAGAVYPPGTAATLELENSLKRYDGIQACASGAADAGVDLTKFQGIVTILVAHEHDPTAANASATLAVAAAPSDSTIQVASPTGFPSPPFAVGVGSEEMLVTAESGTGNTTWTVERGFEMPGNTCSPGGPNPSAALSIAVGAKIGYGAGGDLGACAVGRVSGFTVGDGAHQETLNNVGLVRYDALANTAGLPHEMSHALLGAVHSSDLVSQTDYQDPWDMMSAFGTYFSLNQPAFAQSANYNNQPEKYTWGQGPGFNSVLLDNFGWSDPSQEDTSLVSASSCTTRSVILDPLSITNLPSGHYLEAQLPFTNQSGFPSGSHYTVEFRSPVPGSNYSVWDEGVPETVLIHVAGKSSAFPSYLVDGTVGGALVFQGAQPAGLTETGGQPISSGFPEFVAGSTFVDPQSNAYLAVNQIVSGSDPTAQVTLGTCTLATSLSYVGDTVDDFNDTATLSAKLTTQPGSGPSGPVDNQPVTLSVGTQSCPATTTGPDGIASCQLILTQDPTTTTVSASFAGTSALAAASTSAAFTISPEDTQLVNYGATKGDYHDVATMDAQLTDPTDSTPIQGKTVHFQVGSSPVDSCLAITDPTGHAICQITPTQAAGSYTMTASFAGDTDYASTSAPQPFMITKEETTTTYTGPTVILKGASGATLSGRLLEDGNPSVPIVGRTLTLGLGSQHCTGTTDPTGTASCSLIFTGALGPQPLSASFGGDAYYLPSSDTSSVATVFSFPSRGAFTLGDLTESAAIPSTTVTWWADTWGSLNSLSGGPSPAAFKGFAGTVSLPSTSPAPSCTLPWTTMPGDSPPPTGSVPSYMGVLVTSGVGQSGSTIAGTAAHIVVVKVKPGYAPNPGAHGTGTIVATFC